MMEAGECSSRELVDLYFGRVDAVNGVINAIVAEDRERTIQEAHAADCARRGGAKKPLLGLPVTVKDSLDVGGWTSAAGSQSRARYRPSSDAAAVSRIRDAGAIVLGKTNVPEYSWSGECDNVVYGRTSNPFDTSRTSGGSSGGEAAILGADASPIGIGTDGGSSIRIPAHYCGVVGLRPTVGVVPESGTWPPTRATGMLDMTCVGPMGRYVEDLALLLPILAGPDGVDPYAVPVALGDWRAVDTGRLRVGYFASAGVARCSDATRKAVERAATALAESGCAVVEASPPPIDEATSLFFSSMAADGGAKARADTHGPDLEHHPAFSALLESLQPFARDAAGFFELQRRVFAFRARVRRWTDDFDIVVCPVAGRPAPIHGYVGGLSFEARAEELNYAPTFSLAGLPVVSVPAGHEGGLPIGVQIVARAYHDHVALAAADVVERQVGGFCAMPGRPAPGTGARVV
jgi:Asp-tRNA(Asn)/Glu-tRNA(Gln) amidotransferase A subunit family amidase